MLNILPPCLMKTQLASTQKRLKDQECTWKDEKESMQQDMDNQAKQAEEERNTLHEQIAALEFEVGICCPFLKPTPHSTLKR